MKKAFQVKNQFYLKQPTIFVDNKKNADGSEQKVCQVVEQKQAGFDSLTSVMEEYSSTAAFSSFICLLFCSKKKKKKKRG